MLFSASCARSTKAPASEDQEDGEKTAESAQNVKPTKPVERPDPMFEQYEYPGSTRVGAVNLGATVSATYRSQDSYDKVVEFYRQKFSASDQVQVKKDISYFGVTNTDGGGLTATISPGSGNLTEIILRHDKKQ